MTSTPLPRPKPAWPLLLVAVLAFIPFIGVLFGAIAVTWALVTDRPRARLSLVIGGTGAVLNLAIPVVIALRAPHDQALDRVLAEQARDDLSKLVLELERYHSQTGHYPPNLQALVLGAIPIPPRFINIYDRTQGAFRLRVYEYHLSADGTTYDLYSVGPDGQAHTSDDIRPVVPDSLRESAGYRPAR
jgi:hypothetical protein